MPISFWNRRANNQAQPLSQSEQIERGEFTSFKKQKAVDLNTDNKDLQIIVKDWIDDYGEYGKKQLKQSKINQDYYLGQQTKYKVSFIDQPIVDNVLFEATETFLPQATATNPDPVVNSVNDGLRITASAHLRKILEDEADRLVLKQKLKKMTRQWSINKLGVLNFGWDPVEDDIETEVVRMQRLILDKDATIDEKGQYTGDYLGHNKVKRAEDLKNLVRNIEKSEKGALEAIDRISGGEGGTKIAYREWWTDEMVFWTLNEAKASKPIILGRMKNPHWNYDETLEIETIAGKITKDIVGVNHFKAPKIPYNFLSVFNLGLHPHDDTVPLEQNRSQQDLINKRQVQVDENVSKMNNAIAFSGKALSKEQAARANQAMNEGKAVWVPKGVDIRAAIMRLNPPGLPADVFNHLIDTRGQLRNIYGTTGLSSAGLGNEKTVGGKILTRESDFSRIGGTITTKIEQVADSVYNWWVQLIFVYFDKKNYEEYLGVEKARELMEILEQQKSQGKNPAFRISVKDGSMLPKDPLTRRNEAIELAQQGFIDPLTLFERLDDPDPTERARRLLLAKNNVQQYITEILGIEQAQEAGGMMGEVMGQPPDGQPVEGGQTTQPQLLNNSIDNLT